MMTYLQHGTADVIAGIQNIVFFRGFRISGEQEAGLPVFNADDNGSVVGIIGFVNRADDLTVRTA